MEINITQETCCREECHVTFWITCDMQTRFKKTHESFYCPNGHAMHYTGENDEQKIRNLERERDKILSEKKLIESNLKFHEEKAKKQSEKMARQRKKLAHQRKLKKAEKQSKLPAKSKK